MKSWWLLVLMVARTAGAQTNLTGHAAELFKLAQDGKFYATASKLNPEYLPASDGQSFLVHWPVSTNTPAHWLVSLPGTEGFATDDLANWSPHLKNRDVSVISIQWWLGPKPGGSRNNYYSPEQIYREIDLALQKLKAAPGTVMFHGFSRGSANAYAIAALDAGRGHKYFALHVASSGGVSLDYPPIRAILDGRYGDHPLRGTRWITVAGGRDPNPDRDGIPAMRRTAEWLKSQDAVIEAAIEDPGHGHGALMLNPQNVGRVLDLFVPEKPSPPREKP